MWTLNFTDAFAQLELELQICNYKLKTGYPLTLASVRCSSLFSLLDVQARGVTSEAIKIYNIQNKREVDGGWYWGSTPLRCLRHNKTNILQHVITYIPLLKEGGDPPPFFNDRLWCISYIGRPNVGSHDLGIPIGSEGIINNIQTKLRLHFLGLS